MLWYTPTPTITPSLIYIQNNFKLGTLHEPRIQHQSYPSYPFIPFVLLCVSLSLVFSPCSPSQNLNIVIITIATLLPICSLADADLLSRRRFVYGEYTPPLLRSSTASARCFSP
ncbi:hypothetical protein RND81_04G037100 [Saponaria officinalis]|uniref:Transmembrane protein n=1 Tax=Saponaria officinalis TaxID=3572 RepID=A0AAW1LJ02_SAPOF